MPPASGGNHAEKNRGLALRARLPRDVLVSLGWLDARRGDFRRLSCGVVADAAGAPRDPRSSALKRAPLGARRGRLFGCLASAKGCHLRKLPWRAGAHLAGDGCRLPRLPRELRGPCRPNECQPQPARLTFGRDRLHGVPQGAFALDALLQRLSPIPDPRHAVGKHRLTSRLPGVRSPSRRCWCWSAGAGLCGL